MKAHRIITFALLCLLGCGEGGEPASASNDDDLGPTDPCDACSADQLCEEEACVDKPEGWIDPNELAGRTYAFMCVFNGSISAPPGCMECETGSLCNDIPPIGFTVWGAEEQGQRLLLSGATLDRDGEYDPTESLFLHPTPGDFSTNPMVWIRFEGSLEFMIEGRILRIYDLEFTGRIKSDLLGWTEGTFGGVVDPGPLEQVLGSPPCELIPGMCDEEGAIPLFIELLEAVAVDTKIPLH